MEKGLTLDVVTRGQSTAIFLCIGPFSAWWQTINQVILVQACSWPVIRQSFAITIMASAKHGIQKKSRNIKREKGKYEIFTFAKNRPSTLRECSMALRSSLPPCKKECKFTTSFQFCPQAVAVPLLSSTSCATLKVMDEMMISKITTIASVYQICQF